MKKVEQEMSNFCRSLCSAGVEYIEFDPNIPIMIIYMHVLINRK